MSKPLEIVEVGAASYCNLTGSGDCDRHLSKISPRTVVLQPPDQLIPAHEAYHDMAEKWRKQAPALGVHVVYCDIYQPSTHINSFTPGSVGLWALSDVINDPYYPEENKDFEIFATLLKRSLTPGGLVLFADYCWDIRADHSMLRYAWSLDFEVLVDQIIGNPRSASPKYPLISGLLTSLGVMDDALEIGLQRHLDHRWAIY